MMNRSQNTSFLALGLLLLIGIGVLAFIDEPEKNTSEFNWSKPFDEVDKKKIDKIKIEEASGEVTSITKIANIWWIEQPKKTRADEKRIKNILESVLDVECGDPISDSVETYQLDKPKWQVWLKNNDDVLAHLRIGQDTQVGWKSYVQCGSDVNVRLSNSKMSTSFHGGFESIRFKKAFTYAPEQIDTMVFPNGFEAQLRNKTWWNMSPIRIKLDDDTIKQQIAQLLAIGIEKFEGTPLVEQSLIWTLASEDSEESLEFHQQSIKSSIHNEIMTISEEDSVVLQKDIKELYSKKILFNNNPLIRIDINLNKKSFNAEVNDGAWTDDNAAFNLLKGPNSLRKIGKAKEAIGKMVLQYQDETKVTFTIHAEDETGVHWMTYADEDALILLPTELVSMLK